MGNADLRVVSYNFKGLQMDEGALVRVLQELQPDVVAVQEPPRFANARGRLRALAKRCGLEVVVYGNYPFGGVTTALLAKPAIASQVTSKGAKVLPFDPWKWAPHWTRTKARTWPSRRGYSYMVCGTFAVFSVHLGLNPMERHSHRNIILNQVKKVGPGRCIVAGDINEHPGGESWRAFERPLRDAIADIHGSSQARALNTFPATRQRARIDATFVGAGLTVRDARVFRNELTEFASDHLPLVVDLEVRSRQWRD